MRAPVGTFLTFALALGLALPLASEARAGGDAGPAHIHGEGCGHWLVGGAWRDVPAEHVHGPRCGHEYEDGAWTDFPREHEHRPGCGHYFWNGRWSHFPSAHRHSPACGHHFYAGMWHPFPAGHAHRRGCGHHYYDGCWHLFPAGHVHGEGCGHEFADGEWRLLPSMTMTVRLEGEPADEADAEPEGQEASGERDLEVVEAVELVPPPVTRLKPIEIEPERSDVVLTISGGPITVVEAGHRHGFGCGHYRHGGGWYATPPRAVYTGYGTGQGYYYWLSDRSYHAEKYPNAPHEHRIGCGHYYWGGAYRGAPSPGYVATGRWDPALRR